LDNACAPSKVCCAQCGYNPRRFWEFVSLFQGCISKLSQVMHKVGPSHIRNRHKLGLRVSNLLTGAWRHSAQTSSHLSNLTEAELTEILPLLWESGAGALGWWSIRNTPLANSRAGQQLHEVYRRFRLSALIHEREIAYVLSLLRAEGIEPVLVKGWAIARLYPDAGLRPYGDIDLCIRPGQFARAAAALKCLEDIDGHYIDLHCGFTRIGQTKAQVPARADLCKPRIYKDNTGVWDELFSRSQLVPLGPVSSETDPVATEFVRILSDEDHLRLLSSHLLRSGARRPPWLCDIALLLESHAEDFNWDVCVGQARRQTAKRSLNWIATAIGLAHQLLGADVCGVINKPLADRARNLPRWLAPAVLHQWGRRRDQSQSVIEEEGAVSRVPGDVSDHKRGPLDIGVWTRLVDLYARWDNPVRATAAIGGRFNSWPRFPYRVGELFLRIPEIPEQLSSLVEQFAVQRRETAAETALRQARWHAGFGLD
jgi:hypothetical protein